MSAGRSAATSETRFTRLTAIDAAAVRRAYLSYRVSPYPEQQIAGILDWCPGVGAQFADELIGFAYLEQFSSDIVQLGNIFVARDFRSRGLGAELLSRLSSIAKARGFAGWFAVNSMEYATHEPKRSAFSFYVAQGFSCALRTERSDLFTQSLLEGGKDLIDGG